MPKEVCLITNDLLVEATCEGCDENFTLRPELKKITNILFAQVCGNCISYSVQGWPEVKWEGEESPPREYPSSSIENNTE